METRMQWHVKCTNLCGFSLMQNNHRVISQLCCGLTHALLHVCKATLKKAEYDDNVLFYAIWCPLERQQYKDLTVVASLVKQQPFSLCFCKCMFDFTVVKPLSSHLINTTMNWWMFWWSDKCFNRNPKFSELFAVCHIYFYNQKVIWNH